MSRPCLERLVRFNSGVGPIWSFDPVLYEDKITKKKLDFKMNQKIYFIHSGWGLIS